MVPNADQEKNQGANRAKPCTKLKKITETQLSFSGLGLDSSAEIISENSLVMIYNYCGKGFIKLKAQAFAIIQTHDGVEVTVMGIAMNGAVNFAAKGAIKLRQLVFGVFAAFPCQELQAF